MADLIKNTENFISYLKKYSNYIFKTNDIVKNTITGENSTSYSFSFVPKKEYANTFQDFYSTNTSIKNEKGETIGEVEGKLKAKDMFYSSKVDDRNSVPVISDFGINELSVPSVLYANSYEDYLKTQENKNIFKESIGFILKSLNSIKKSAESKVANNDKFKSYNKNKSYNFGNLLDNFLIDESSSNYRCLKDLASYPILKVYSNYPTFIRIGSNADTNSIINSSHSVIVLLDSFEVPDGKELSFTCKRHTLFYEANKLNSSIKPFNKDYSKIEIDGVLFALIDKSSIVNQDIAKYVNEKYPNDDKFFIEEVADKSYYDYHRVDSIDFLKPLQRTIIKNGGTLNNEEEIIYSNSDYCFECKPVQIDESITYGTITVSKNNTFSSKISNNIRVSKNSENKLVLGTTDNVPFSFGTSFSTMSSNLTFYTISENYEETESITTAFNDSITVKSLVQYHAFRTDNSVRIIPNYGIQYKKSNLVGPKSTVNNGIILHYNIENVGLAYSRIGIEDTYLALEFLDGGVRYKTSADGEYVYDNVSSESLDVTYGVFCKNGIYTAKYILRNTTTKDVLSEKEFTVSPFAVFSNSFLSSIFANKLTMKYWKPSIYSIIPENNSTVTLSSIDIKYNLSYDEFYDSFTFLKNNDLYNYERKMPIILAPYEVNGFVGEAKYNSKYKKVAMKFVYCKKQEEYYLKNDDHNIKEDNLLEINGRKLSSSLANPSGFTGYHIDSKSSTKKPPTVNSSVEGKTSIRKINYNVSNNFTSNSGWKLIKFNRFKQ